MLVSPSSSLFVCVERLMADGRGGEGSKIEERVNSARVKLVKNQKIKNQLFKVVRPRFEHSSPRAAF